VVALAAPKQRTLAIYTVSQYAKSAQQLARTAARVDPPLPEPQLPTLPPLSTTAPDSSWLPGVKVFIALQAESQSKAVAIRGRDKGLGPDRDSHRGALLNATSGAEFWKLVCGWTDLKPRSAQVTAGQLRDVFEKRLDPPDVLPEHFNVEQHEWNTFMAGNIPETTEDHAGKAILAALHNRGLERMKVRIPGLTVSRI